MFEMKDLGEAKQILGMKITRDKQNHLLRLSQEDYIDKVLKIQYERCKVCNYTIGKAF